MQNIFFMIFTIIIKSIFAQEGIVSMKLSPFTNYNASSTITINDNKKIVGVVNNEVFTIDSGKTEAVLDDKPTDVISSGLNCKLFPLLTKTNIGIICNETVFVFDTTSSTSKSFVSNKQIYSINEYQPDMYILITGIQPVYEIKFIMIPLSGSSSPSTSVSDTTSIKCSYIPNRSLVVCMYIKDQEPKSLSAKMFDNSLLMSGLIIDITTIRVKMYFMLCDEIKCFMLIQLMNEIVGQIVVLNPTLTPETPITIFTTSPYFGGELIRMSATILIATFEKASNLYIQLLTETFEKHGPLIPFSFPETRISSNNIGVFNYFTLVYTQIIMVRVFAPVEISDQLAIFITFPSCQDISYTIGFNRLEELDILNSGKIIQFSQKPTDVSHEIIGLQTNIDYNFPLKIQFSKSGQYQYVFSSYKTVTSPISSSVENTNLYSTLCYLTIIVCQTNQVPSIARSNCIIQDELEKEMDNIMVDIEDKILTMNPKQSVGNSTYEIYDTSNLPATGSNTNLSSIDLGECETVLRNYYNIPFEDSLLIFKKDTNVEGRTGNKVEYAVFMKNGSILNMSLCDKVEIIIEIPVLNTHSSEFDLIKNLSEKSKVNLYDPHDSFFNDICFSFTTNNGLDIPRKDRVKHYLQNSSAMCPHGCSVKKVDFNSNSTLCSCTDQSTPPPAPNANPFQDIKDSLMNSIINGNWKVMFCYQSVFNREIFVKNIGSWLILSISFVLTITTITFLINGLTNIEQYFNHVDIEKRIEKKKKLKDVHKAVSQKPIMLLENPYKIEQRISRKSVPENQIAIQTVNKQFLTKNTMTKNLKRKNKSSHEVNILNMNNFISKRHLKLQSSKNNINFFNNEQVQRDATRRSNQVLVPIKTFTSEDYDRMPFDQCVTEDNRSMISHYWRYLKLVHPILSTFFCKAKPTIIRSILISQFFIGLMIDNTLSAFFYSDLYISKNYENKGSINFWYNLPISLYSFLAGTIFNVIFNLLSNIEFRVEAIEKREIVDVEMFLEIKRALTCFKVKLVFYFILQFIVIAFCWYYTTAFCGTYINSQIEWLISGLISISIGLAIPFLVALIYSIILKVSYALKCQCCFRMLKFLV